MALVTQSNSGAAFSSLLAPFTSVATATVRPLKGISAAELATLREGDTVYTTNLRDYWKWLPASVIASDDITYCAPTVVGAGAGRFERLLFASPDWKLQTAWVINSTALNDEGDGSAGAPLKTDVELNRRWGWGTRARLAVSTSVTYAQSPTTVTNYSIDLPDSININFFGTPLVTKPGTILTAVQVQVRTVGAELGWAVTGAGLGAADVGKTIVITASGTPANVGGYAAVLKDEGGGKIRVSPFGTFATANTPFVQVTPVVGDTIEIRDMTSTTLAIGTIEVRCVANIGNSGANSVTYSAFHQLHLSGNSTQGLGAIEPYRLPAFYDKCTYATILLGGTSGGLGNARHRIAGGQGGGTNIRVGATATYDQVGFLSSPGISGASFPTFSADCYFQNCGLTINRSVFVNTLGIVFFDRSAADSSLFISVGGMCQQTGAIPDWGTANAGHGIVVSSASSYTYATKPTINGGLGVGREARIGGTDKLYGVVPYIEGANNAALVLTA